MEKEQILGSMIKPLQELYSQEDNREVASELSNIIESINKILRIENRDA